MRPITGYSEATAINFNGGERLPAGGYIKIGRAHV